MLFHNLSLEAFCHATEDTNKVRSAFSALVPHKINQGDFSENKFEGSFGNEIIAISLDICKQANMRKVIEHLKKTAIFPDDFDISDHVTDDRMFWVRFDKQKAFEGKVCFGGADTIQLRGKIAAFPAKRERAIELISRVWNKKVER